MNIQAAILNKILINPATQKKDNVMINLAFFHKSKISLTLKKIVKELETNVAHNV